MPLHFELYASKGNEMINRIADELEVPRDQAARILKSTLHALRSQLTISESFDFLSQLPMIIKAVYVDGWNPSKEKKQVKSITDFFDEIRSDNQGLAAYDFGNEIQTFHTVKAVFKVLREYVSTGEWEDMQSVVSKPLKRIFNQYV